ncbi:MAG TPA: NUDIX hydrolase N-terminal domain-containing protein [Candidatus Binataceae bacterium]|jgi:ADP-ribose pyrophosphatase YjhB (NUDIX family)|nr:NUDIX hydrolase N-terminal domain-containing protein [Candidatus Binataceae bacterium]
MSSAALLLELARFVERVSAIARTGLAFQPSGYDAERYEELLHEAARMRSVLETADGTDHEAIFQRWRAEVRPGYDGYVTAGVGCGAIAFNERDELLMIQRPSGRWWYPTGFCEVGVSPAENVAREVREETGLSVTPLRLLGVLDSLKLGSPFRHLYSMLFYCRLDGGALRPHPLETLDVRFFPLDRLPADLHGASRRWIDLARQFHFEGRLEPYFDPL